MYIQDAPVYFTKGDKRKPVYHSVLARELLAAGWQQEGVTPAPEPVAVEPVEAAPEAEQPSQSEEETDPEPEPEVAVVDLDSMTKNQLVAFAEASNIEFKSTVTKSELLQLCKDSVND
jgi:hypothetical protein